MMIAKIKTAVMACVAVLVVGRLGFAEGTLAATPADGPALITVQKDGKGDFIRIEQALYFSKPGDVVEIQDSQIYPESLDLTAYPKRTIRAKVGRQPIICGKISMGEGCVLEGLKITYPFPSGAPISASSNGWTVRDCDIYDIPYNTHAFYLASGVSDAKILNNRVHDGKGAALYLQIARSNYVDKGSNLIAGNVFANLGGFYTTADTRNNKIVFNTFYKTPINIASATTVFANNIVASGTFTCAGSVHHNCFYQSARISGNGNIEADPLFVNAEKGDLHLRPGSPSAEAGDPSAGSSNKPDGKRPSMGAYGNPQYASAPKAQTQPTPDHRYFQDLKAKYLWIQDKIDALPPEGGVVDIPEGRHVIGPVLIDRSGITLRGKGPDKTTLLSYGPSGVILKIASNTQRVGRVSIEGMSMVGGTTLNRRLQSIFVFNATDTALKNLRISYCGGVFLGATKAVAVTDSTFDNTEGGILTYQVENPKDAVTGTIVDNCRFSNTNHWWAIDFQSERGGRISSCWFQSTLAGAIKLYAGAANTVVRDNTIDSSRHGAPIGVYGAGGSVIERNVIRNCADIGAIAVGYPYGNGTVIIRNNVIYSNAGPGIEFNQTQPHTDKISIVSNVICGNGGDGIWIRPNNHQIVDARDNIITGNRGFGINRESASLAGSYNNVWGNTSGDYKGVSPSAGDLSVDPLFANLANGDFHLKSKTGRWDSESKKWVKDAVISPCIDAGDPKADFSKESAPNGGRINIGAYGNTAEASRSE